MSAAKRLTVLPCIADSRGKLTVIESGVQVPFRIQRAFFIYDLPPNAQRGGHAHRACHEFIVILNGHARVDLDDGGEQWHQVLTGPHEGVHVKPMTWLGLRDFAPGTICAVFASEIYDPGDYIRDYDVFLREVRA